MPQAVIAGQVAEVCTSLVKLAELARRELARAELVRTELARAELV